MDQELKALEEERRKLYRGLSGIGDFRRGMISVNYRKCGKPNCICAKEGHPGHGPQYLWNATIKCKSYARSIPLGPELEKCKQDHAIFLDQTRRAGERAAERAKLIEYEQRRIADETAKSWAAALDYVRADAARRMRLAAGNSGGSGLSQAAQSGLQAPAADPDPIPPPEKLAADCAETTLTANALQSYIERLQHE